MTLKTLRLIMAHATERGKHFRLVDIRPELAAAQFREWQAQSMAVIAQAAKAEAQ